MDRICEAPERSLAPWKLYRIKRRGSAQAIEFSRVVRDRLLLGVRQCIGDLLLLQCNDILKDGLPDSGSVDEVVGFEAAVRTYTLVVTEYWWSLPLKLGVSICAEGVCVSLVGPQPLKECFDYVFQEMDQLVAVDTGFYDPFMFDLLTSQNCSRFINEQLVLLQEAGIGQVKSSRYRYHKELLNTWGPQNDQSKDATT